ncbi:MAG: hypothetical protein ABSC92_01310 [Rhizomicrobium sp.]|jgi:hypothetical protein
MTKWREAAIGFGIEPVIVGGLNVWEEEWRPVALPSVPLPHPSYPQQIHSYKIYEIGDSKLPMRFAACELSNQVWGFYVPDENSN